MGEVRREVGTPGGVLPLRGPALKNRAREKNRAAPVGMTSNASVEQRKPRKTRGAGVNAGRSPSRLRINKPRPYKEIGHRLC